MKQEELPDRPANKGEKRGGKKKKTPDQVYKFLGMNHATMGKVDQGTTLKTP